MIKFTVQIPKSTDVKAFLSTALDSYITVFVTKSSCYFILNSTEVYIHKNLIILSSENLEEALSFRLERKLILNMVIDGYILFLVDDSDITITFKNKESINKFTMTVIHQKGIAETIFNKMRLIASAGEYPELNLLDIKSLIRVANNLGLPITIQNGFACTVSRNYSCYKKTKLPDFSASSKVLTIILKFSTYVHNVQNYLIFEEDGVAVVVTKNKDFPVADVEFAIKQKSSHKVDLKIDNIIDLCARVEKIDGVFTLDVEKRIVSFSNNSAKYTTPIIIEDIKSVKSRRDKQKSSIEFNMDSLESMVDNIDSNAVMLLSEHLVPKVDIPTIVLTRLLPALGLKERASLYYKKTFMQVQNEDTYVIFTRKEVKNGH